MHFLLIKSRQKQAASQANIFKIDQFMNKPNDSIPLHISRTKFRVSSENQITLIDQTQIIGVTADQENKLILENLSTNETIQIDSSRTTVKAVVFLRNNDKSILIVGDSLGFVKKYEFVSSDKQ